MKISIGIGFLLRPLLEVLSPLSLAVPTLSLDSMLSRLVNPRSISRERLMVGLRGTLNPVEGFLECEDAFGDLVLVGEVPGRWNRSIHEEAEGGACRDASREESVDEDQRERNVLSEVTGMVSEGGVVGGVKELELYIPATGLSGSVGSIEISIAPDVGVSTSKSKEDMGEHGSSWVTRTALGWTLMLSGVMGIPLSE